MSDHLNSRAVGDSAFLQFSISTLTPSSEARKTQNHRVQISHMKFLQRKDEPK